MLASPPLGTILQQFACVNRHVYVRELVVLALSFQLQETSLALDVSRLPNTAALILDYWPVPWIIIEAGLQCYLWEVVYRRATL